MAHAAVLSALHGECFEEAWDEKAMGDILAMPGTTGLIVGTDDETPEGFIVYRIAADEAEIITIGVLPDARRGGLAKILLTNALERGTNLGVRKMFLEVAEDNFPAKSFYEKSGFKQAGIRAGYYARPQGRIDALVYSFEITPK